DRGVVRVVAQPGRRRPPPRCHRGDLLAALARLVGDGIDEGLRIAEVPIRDGANAGDIRLDQVERLVGREDRIDTGDVGGPARTTGLLAACGERAAARQGGGAKAHQGEDLPSAGEEPTGTARWLPPIQGVVHGVLPSLPRGRVDGLWRRRDGIWNVWDTR